MNIFYLDKTSEKAALYHCDKHVPKMILETAQMLSTAKRLLCPSRDYHASLGSDIYQAAYPNHPSTRWVRESIHNYTWAYCLYLDLCTQYRNRFNKIHSAEKLRPELGKLPDPPSDHPFYSNPWSEPPLCMPDQYKDAPSCVEAYRAYYFFEKQSFASWERCAKGMPAWFKSRLELQHAVQKGEFSDEQRTHTL